MRAQNRWGWSGYFRSVLRTDDDGRGSVLGEIRRQAIPTVSNWTGIRLAAVIPVYQTNDDTVGLMPEFELIIPDEREPGTGTVWPLGQACAPLPARLGDGRSQRRRRRAPIRTFESTCEGWRASPISTPGAVTDEALGCSLDTRRARRVRGRLRQDARSRAGT